MLEIRDGVNCFKFKDRQVLITPDLKKLNIPLDLTFPPPKIENLSEKLLKRFKKRGVIVSSIENRKKPSYKTQCILEKITFRNIAIEYVDNIFQECLKNSSMAPLITIDCSLEVTSKLLNLIHRKYSENSINPIIKIFIKDSVEDFLKIIREFLNARESIELNNLFLIIQHKIINNELIKDIKESIDPLELYLYYENIPDYITHVEEFNWDYNLPILLEIDERMISLNLNEIKRFPIVVNEDSIFRLLSAFKLKSYTVNEFLRKQLFLPYCGACNNRIFIEGRGKIYACNTGYRCNDQLGSLTNTSMKEILHSEKFRKLRNKIEENSKKYQKESSLANFYSGCLYLDKFEKCSLMKKILQIFIQ